MLGKTIRRISCAAVLAGSSALAFDAPRLVIQPVFVDKSGGVQPQVGDVYRFDLIATLRGDNANLTDEGLWGTVGSVYSSNVGTGTCRGNLTATPFAPFNGMGSVPAMQRDLDWDGDLDAGGWNPNQATDYLAIRSSWATYTTGAPQRFKIAAITFTLTEIISNPSADADTHVRFALRPTQDQAQCWFFSDGEFYANWSAIGLSDGSPRPPEEDDPIGPADVINDPFALQLASTSLRGIVPGVGDYFVHGNLTAPPVVAPGLTRVFAGTLSTSSVLTGGTQIDAGARINLTGPASDPASKTGTIAIDTAATFDLGNTSLIIASASAAERDAALAQAEARIASARNVGTAGRWSGLGITSSVLAGNSLMTLALVPNDPALGGPGLAEFDGVAVGTNAILIGQTFAGDFNLDGRVDIDDYFRIDTGYARGGTHAWQGDINYDGLINGDDFFAIDASFLGQSAGLAAATPQSVPEPASVGLLGAAALLAIRRRRA